MEEGEQLSAVFYVLWIVPCFESNKEANSKIFI